MAGMGLHVKQKRYTDSAILVDQALLAVASSSHESDLSLEPNSHVDKWRQVAEVAYAPSRDPRRAAATPSFRP